MEFKKLLASLDKVKNKKIGVIGDLCIDIYWHADMKLSELSLETPHFPLPIVNEKFGLGAAGNIVNNLSVLDVERIDFITVIGNDWRKTIALDLLNKLDKVEKEYIISSENRVTPAYCKPIKHGISDVVYEDPRLDFWNINQIDEKTEEEIIHKLKLMAERVDVIIVEEQLKNSVITDKVRESICELGAEGKVIIVDSRLNPHLYKNCIIKPNEQELDIMARKLDIEKDNRSLEEISEDISNRLNSELVVTLGDKGSIWLTKDNIYRMDSFKVEGQIDIVGAGDGFIAGLAAFNKFIPKENVLLLCNLISSIVIRKIGTTGSASREEIIKQFVVEMKDSFFFKLSGIENPDIKCAIFDFDGTISTLRHGWENIMFSYVFDQLYPYYEDDIERLERKIWDFIDETTGVQTIYQMQWIVDEVKSQAGTPLDQWEYKDGYNDALIKVVRNRVDKLMNGELEEEDFRVPGSKEFIENLVNEGIKCYIASGTDDVDIKKEMKSIGVDHLFEDSKGAPDRKIDCPKTAVYNKLTKELGYKANEILIVGDGKVEINIGKENNSLTLGVACDEYSLKGIDVKKLDRLISAGANAIVIDFKDFDRLMDWLKEGI